MEERSGGQGAAQLGTLPLPTVWAALPSPGRTGWVERRSRPKAAGGLPFLNSCLRKGPMWAHSSLLKHTVVHQGDFLSGGSDFLVATRLSLGPVSKVTNNLKADLQLCIRSSDTQHLVILSNLKPCYLFQKPSLALLSSLTAPLCMQHHYSSPSHSAHWIVISCLTACFFLQTLPESLLGCKEVKSVNPKGNQPWIFIRRTVGEAEALILWSPDAKSHLIGKDSDAGKGLRQKEKGVAEGEMVR